MRDVQDFHKYVDMLSKSVNRRPPQEPVKEENAATPPAAPPPAAKRQHDGTERSRQNGQAGRLRPAETREQLLRRLLDPTLTLDETARILEVCPTTVRRYTNKGLLACQRSAGNQRRFQLSQVLAFKEAQGASVVMGEEE